MDKTININLGGTLFQIDEDAYKILRDYLQAINTRFGNTPGGNETIEDIESRIGEIFQSQKGLAGVITRENVESMISIIGRPEDFDHGEPEKSSVLNTGPKRKMYRNPDDMIIGGVCSGIAAYLDSDPVLFRIMFVLFTFFFGIGFLVYIALWISLPAARTESQKKVMYGDSYQAAASEERKDKNYKSGAAPVHSSPSRLGNAINEVFRALARVFYTIARIILIIIGVLFVLTGFLFILSYIMVFVFKYPGAFSIDSYGVNLIYFPDFLNYLVSPSSVPWIVFLSSVVILLPMIAIIYWGVKMIFWFRARDGVVSLVALVVWVMSLAALAIICFNEGVSFAQTAKLSVESVLPKSPDTLYVVADHKIADLKFEKQISLPHEDYTVYINDEAKELYIRPYLSVDQSFDKKTRVEVRRRSTGRNEDEAFKKTEGLVYNFSLKSDSLKLDEYFTIPPGRKWSADNIGVHLYIPSGTILKFDKESRIMVHSIYHDESEDYRESRWESGIDCWVMTDDGLEPARVNTSAHK